MRGSTAAPSNLAPLVARVTGYSPRVRLVAWRLACDRSSSFSDLPSASSPQLWPCSDASLNEESRPMHDYILGFVCFMAGALFVAIVGIPLFGAQPEDLR